MYKPSDFNSDESKALDLRNFAYNNTLRVIAVSEMNVLQLAYILCSTEHTSSNKSSICISTSIWPRLTDFFQRDVRNEFSA